MGKNKKTKKNKELSGKSALVDDNPMYGSNPDSTLIDMVLESKSGSVSPAVSEKLLFGTKADDKVCPICGMILVDKSNYCIGCGKNVNLIEGVTGGGYRGGYVVGAGYGGGNAYVAREEALKKRRRKNKDVLNETGLTGLLLKVLGVTAGVVIGIFALKWFFSPKDVEETYYREEKVIKLANVRSINAGVKSLPQSSTGNKSARDGRSGNSEFDESMSGGSTQGEKVYSAEQKHRNQHFYGTLHLTAKGDRVLGWDEEEIWDIRGLDSNDVSYIINNLNICYESYLGYVFIDYDIVREEDFVFMNFSYHNLDISENVRDMVALGIVNAEGVVGQSGKEYFSLQRLQKLLDDEKWRSTMPEDMTAIVAAEGDEESNGGL